MVNAKNAFVGTMLAGLIIAAVGTEKYYTGNWDTMSGDFTYSNLEGKFAPMTGRFYAENNKGCTLSETGELTKGTECDMHDGMDYQIEMTNGEYEWFVHDDVLVSTNLATGESVTSKQTKEQSNEEEDREAAEWSVVDGKLTQKDGTQMEVSNAASPGAKIRELWESLKCGFSAKCWGDYYWKKYTTCGGLFWAFWENIGYCIAWLLWMIISGLLIPASGGTAIGGMIVGLSGFYAWCVRGVLVVLVLMLVRCTIDALRWLYDVTIGRGKIDKFFDCMDARTLGGGGWGSGQGGGYGSSNKKKQHCTRELDKKNGGGGCRMLGGGCRALGGMGSGSSSGYKKKKCDCRMLRRDDGGDNEGGSGSGKKKKCC